MLWLRRHWLAVIGAIPASLELARWAKRLLEWGEHTEFVIHRAADIRKLWNMIPEPPWWINGPLILAGFFLVWWDLERKRAGAVATSPPVAIKHDTTNARPQWKHANEVLELADPYKMAAYLEQGLMVRNATQKLEQTPAGREADTVRERLTQEKLAENNKYRTLYYDVVNDIHSKLKSGDLIAQGFLKPVERESSAVPIAPALWRILEFDGDFTEASGEGFSYIGIGIAKSG